MAYEISHRDEEANMLDIQFIYKNNVEIISKYWTSCSLLMYNSSYTASVLDLAAQMKMSTCYVVCTEWKVHEKDVETLLIGYKVNMFRANLL